MSESVVPTAAIPDESTDLLVIGGGLSGLALAWAAARRGLRCVVAERGLPGGGATQVWHGLLADLEAEVPFRAPVPQRRARAALRGAAPHLVTPLSLLAPAWRPEDHRALLGWGARLLLDELRGPDTQLRYVRRRTRRALLAEAPALRARSLAGGLAVTVPRLEPVPFAVALERGAAASGVALRAYTEAVALHREDGRVAGARLQPRHVGVSSTVSAAVTVFAGGAAPPPDAAAAPASHCCRLIAVARRRLDIDTSLLVRSAVDGTRLLVRVEGETVIAGPLAPVPADGDGLGWVTSLLRGLNAAFPAARLSHGDVHGVRSCLVHPGEAELAEREDGLLVWRTGMPARVLLDAGRAADRVAALVAARTGRAPVAPAEGPLPGGEAHDLAPLAALGREAGLAPETIDRCLARYGTEAAAVFNLAQRSRRQRARLHPESAAIGAEVTYAVQRESARTVGDVLHGLLAFDLHTSDGGAAAAEPAASLLGEALGWTDAERREAAAVHVAATARAVTALAQLGA